MNNRPHCKLYQRECISTECTHFVSRRPMTDYEYKCMLCYEADLDPYVYDWCEMYKKVVPVTTIEVFPEDI